MYCIYNTYTWYMSCIYQIFMLWSFERERCFLKLFWLQHYIILIHGNGIQHCIAHKYMKMKFTYLVYIRGIYQAYTASLYIHGIYMVYTDFIPHQGSRCFFTIISYYIICQKSSIISLISQLLYQLFYFSLLLLLYQLKQYYITYFKSYLLYHLFISTLLFQLFYFEAINTIISIISVLIHLFLFQYIICIMSLDIY